MSDTNEMWPEAGKRIVTGSTTQGQYANANSTPRLIWATSSWGFLQDNGGSSTTVQFGASRLKSRLAGGNWGGIAVVHMGATQATKSKVGINNIPKYQISANFERANGTLTPNTYQSPNTGGSKVAFTWSGLSSASVIGAQITVSDIIYPSAFSLSTFIVSDRTTDYWVRTAFSKTNATDNLGQYGRSSYNWPRNDYWGDCTSFANAQTLIGTNGIPVLGGANNWGTSWVNQSIPGQAGLLGLPSDGQKAILFTGTSIFNGQNVPLLDPGGVNPVNPVAKPANFDNADFGSFFADDLNISAPVLSLALGATSLADTWSTSPTLGDNGSAVNARRIVHDLAQWFDYYVLHDVHNDTNNAAWQAAVVLCCDNIRHGNPNIKIIACRPPLDVIGIGGAATGAGTANDAKWTYLATLVGTKIDAIFDLRESGNALWPMLADRVSAGVVTAGASTTSLTWGTPYLKGTLVYSWIQFTSGTNNGLKRVITGNDPEGSPGQITWTGATTVNVVPGDTFKILGNTSGETDGLNGLHGVYWGYQRMKSNFLTLLQAYDPSFKVFTRTA